MENSTSKITPNKRHLKQLKLPNKSCKYKATRSISEGMGGTTVKLTFFKLYSKMKDGLSSVQKSEVEGNILLNLLAFLLGWSF